MSQHNLDRGAVWVLGPSKSFELGSGIMKDDSGLSFSPHHAQGGAPGGLGSSNKFLSHFTPIQTATLPPSSLLITQASPTPAAAPAPAPAAAKSPSSPFQAMATKALADITTVAVDGSAKAVAADRSSAPEVGSRRRSC